MLVLEVFREKRPVLVPDWPATIDSFVSVIPVIYAEAASDYRQQSLINVNMERPSMIVLSVLISTHHSFGYLFRKVRSDLIWWLKGIY